MIRVGILNLVDIIFLHILIVSNLVATSEIHNMKYNQALRKLYQINQGNPVKLGLENTLNLYNALNKPSFNIPIIHVAGTNGKGSVTVKIAEALSRSNIKTGFYVSPHISSFRERIQVDSKLISENDFVQIFEEVVAVANEQNTPATFFELATLIGLQHFQNQQCEAIVLEVGLGGRLDSTNVVNADLCIITSVQLDHMHMLGDTLEKIAVEKGGIMKSGVKILVGPDVPLHVLQELAIKTPCPLYTLDDILSSSERRYNKQNTRSTCISNSLLLSNTCVSSSISIITSPEQCDNNEISNNNSYQDIDDLNTDIALAAIRLLKQPNFTPNTFKNTDKFLQLSEPIIQHSITKRPPCRFEQVSLEYDRKLRRILSTEIISIKPPPISDTSISSTSLNSNNNNSDKNHENRIDDHATTTTTTTNNNNNNDNYNDNNDRKDVNRIENRNKIDMDVNRIEVVLDIAHNPDAMNALINKMKKYYPTRPFRVVLGMSADKDVTKLLSILLAYVPSPEYIYPVTARTPRAMSGQEIQNLISNLSSTTTTNADIIPNIQQNQSIDNDKYSVRQGILRAIQDSVTNTSTTTNSTNSDEVSNNGVILICGTAFIMSEARACIGIIEPQDSLILATSSSSSSSTSTSNSSSLKKDLNENSNEKYLDAQEYFGKP